MATSTPGAVFVVDFPHRLNTQVLAQFCGARTEPYTGYVSYVLCKDFKISIKGQRNMNNALNNLPIHRTPDERLTFGWADENLIRTRLVHEGAYEHLAIMVTLSEAFHESYAARVMFEMAQMAAGDQDITPHYRQWKNVMHSLNGAFSTTDFGIVVEDYIRLDPYSVHTGMGVSTSKIPIHATTVGEALIALGKVSAGKDKQLTITGSAIIGWLAAVADWLYDLRIAIFSDTGEHLHSTDPGEETQVLFVFQEKPSCYVSSQAWTHDKTRASQSDKSGSEITSYATSIHNTPFTGRVVWQSLLPRVFGRSFHHLDHEDSKPFATMLGAAACLFQSLADNAYPEATAASLVSASNKANTASYGPGLIQTLTNWLPELRRFQGRIDRQLKLSPTDAAQSYRDSLSALRKICDCGICKPLPMNPEPASPDDNPLPDIDTLTLSPSKIPGPPPKNGYCLPTLVETIVALGLTLSRTIVSSQLYPSRAGIQSLYYSQSLRRLSARGLHWTQHFKLVYGDEWNAADHRRLINTIQIFSGSKPTKYLPGNLRAVAHEGICAYFTELEKMNLGRKGSSGRGGEGVQLIRIVSGGVNVRYKVFQRLCVGEVEGEDWDDPWERVRLEHIEEVVCCK